MTMYEAPVTDDRRLWDLWLTHVYQRPIVVADDMGIFTTLGEKRAMISELAERLDFDQRATSVLVRLLASLGLLISCEERFQLADTARVYLQRSSPFYWGHMMRSGVNEWHVSTITEALKKKDSANSVGPQGTPKPKSTGSGRSADGWAQGDISSEQASNIAAMMHSHSLLPAIGTARNYDFTGIKRILDVGGGSGCFMIAIAQAHPTMRSTILDLPTMCEVAKSYIQDGGVADRVDTRPT